MVKILQWQQFINTTIRIHQCQMVSCYTITIHAHQKHKAQCYTLSQYIFIRNRMLLCHTIAIRIRHERKYCNVIQSQLMLIMRQRYTLSQYSFIRNRIPQGHTITARIHQKRYSVIANGATYLRKTIIVTIFTSSMAKMSNT